MLKKTRKILMIIITVLSFVSIAVSLTEYITGKQGWVKNHKPKGIYEKSIKRPLDMLLSMLAFVILFPLMLVVALLVRINLGSPVIFRQDRPGLGGKIFTLYKFRTMTDECDSDGNPLSDDKRLTKFGKWLRSTSLDELPELINIIKGDMSIVGPRPLLVEYLSHYDEKEKHRHDVRPGLTGLSQVKGRNFLSWEERFAYDLKYVDNITFLGDLEIVFKTAKSVVCRSGVSDRSQIHTDEKGDVYIIIDGEKHRYPKSLDKERELQQ